MNKIYECFTTGYNEIYLCSENGQQIARFADCPEGRELFKLIKQQIRNDGGKLLNLDKGEWII